MTACLTTSMFSRVLGAQQTPNNYLLTEQWEESGHGSCLNGRVQKVLKGVIWDCEDKVSSFHTPAMTEMTQRDPGIVSLRLRPSRPTPDFQHGGV